MPCGARAAWQSRRRRLRFFWVLRAWHLQLRLEAVADERVDALVGHVEPELVVEPELDLVEAGEALGAVESLFERVEHGLGQRALSRSHAALAGGEHVVEACVAVAVEPSGDGLSVDVEARSDGLARGGLTGGEQDERVESPLALGIACGTETTLQVVERLGDLREWCEGHRRDQS